MKSGALVHGVAAYGAKALKPGFSFTSQMDLAFALGWPKLTFIHQNHPDALSVLEAYDRWSDTAFLHLSIPEDVARCWVRDYAETFLHHRRDLYPDFDGAAEWTANPGAELCREEAR
jgi:hypothetical protein